MTLQDFIATKPTELRLGQYFYNSYLYRLRPKDNTHRNMDLLYNTRSIEMATMIIQEIMQAYQW